MALNKRLQSRLESTLTVGQLIERLQGLDPSLPVAFSYEYGDYWHTEVAGTIRSVDETAVAFSEYHSMLKIANDDDRDEEEEEGEINREYIVVLS
jgi:hypothetical protein